MYSVERFPELTNVPTAGDIHQSVWYYASRIILIRVILFVAALVFTSAVGGSEGEPTAGIEPVADDEPVVGSKPVVGNEPVAGSGPVVGNNREADKDPASGSGKDSGSDREAPSLGENRLFVDKEQRSQLDNPQTNAVAPVGPLVEPENVAPVVKPTRAPVKKQPKLSTTRYVLNGFVRRPDGSVSVWVNGAELDAGADIELVRLNKSGAVTLRYRGKNRSLYPGQGWQVTKAVAGEGQ